MEFIEITSPYPEREGIVLDNPGKHPFGNDLEPRRRAHDRLRAGSEARPSGPAVPQQGRNPFSRGPGSDPAGLEQNELRSGKRLVREEAPGDERRLAGARLGMEHEQIARRQRPGDLIEMGIKRQGGHVIRDHGILFMRKCRTGTQCLRIGVSGGTRLKNRSLLIPQAFGNYEQIYWI